MSMILQLGIKLGRKKLWQVHLAGRVLLHLLLCCKINRDKQSEYFDQEQSRSLQNIKNPHFERQIQQTSKNCPRLLYPC